MDRGVWQTGALGGQQLDRTEQLCSLFHFHLNNKCGFGLHGPTYFFQ